MESSHVTAAILWVHAEPGNDSQECFGSRSADRREAVTPTRTAEIGCAFAAAVLVIALVAGCQTSALGRRQLKLMSEAEMSQMGAAAFSEISKQTPSSRDALENAMVACVANAITDSLPGANATSLWEVRVFADETPNAFALPGGKIGVNLGLLQVARTQGQLAAVIGHEIAHVTQGHANERVSSELATNTALQLFSVAAGATGVVNSQMIGLLGAGVQVGVLRPFGRKHEREADLIGLDLMAKAGFNPNESVALWLNMAKAGAIGGCFGGPPRRNVRFAG